MDDPFLILLEVLVANGEVETRFPNSDASGSGVSFPAIIQISTENKTWMNYEPRSINFPSESKSFELKILIFNSVVEKFCFLARKNQ